MAHTAKLFRRESGQIQAVTKESKQILEIAKDFVERVKSDPPPALKEKLPPGAGLYKATPPPEKVVLPEEVRSFIKGTVKVPRPTPSSSKTKAVTPPEKAPISERTPDSKKTER